MRILYLSQVLPYPTDAGPKMRSYHLLRYLSQHHSIYLVCFVRTTDTPGYIEHLRSYCEQIITVPIRRSRSLDGMAFIRSLAGQRPFLITRDESKEMNRALEELVKRQPFDFIHADQLWMAPYTLYAQAIAQQNGFHAGIVLDQHNAVHLIPKRMAADIHNPIVRWVLHRESHLMANYEVDYCQKFDTVVWVTKEDYQSVKDKAEHLFSPTFNTHPHHTIIPICIDCDEIKPVKMLSKNPVIFFLGGMHWPPNAEGARWFAQEILPMVKEKLPEAKFLVIGRQPPDELLNKQDIRALGFVQDVEPYWNVARAFVVPLRAGGGMRVKILDAWAHGVPIVSTTIGAEGLDYINGENILIADSMTDMSDAIVRVLTEPGNGEQLAKNGTDWVAQYYDWKKVYHSWDEIYPPIFFQS